MKPISTRWDCASVKEIAEWRSTLRARQATTTAAADAQMALGAKYDIQTAKAIVGRL